MKLHRVLLMVNVLLTVHLIALNALPGASQDTPIGEKWWPSPWGADDQRGAGNRITPTKVQEAARLIRTGKIYSLGRVYETGMPLYGNRHFSLTIPGSPTGGWVWRRRGPRLVSPWPRGSASGRSAGCCTTTRGATSTVPG